MNSLDQKITDILNKYKISLSESGEVLFTNDKENTLRNMMMDYIGKSYQIGTYLYDTPKEQRTPEREEALKDISGEMNVLKTIMVNSNYKPLIDVLST